MVERHRTIPLNTAAKMTTNLVRSLCWLHVQTWMDSGFFKSILRGQMLGYTHAQRQLTQRNKFSVSFFENGYRPYV